MFFVVSLAEPLDGLLESLQLTGSHIECLFSMDKQRLQQFFTAIADCFSKSTTCWSQVDANVAAIFLVDFPHHELLLRQIGNLK